MDRVLNFASGAANNYVKTVAALVVVCALIEPVCKAVRHVWESRVMKLGNEKSEEENTQKSENAYAQINEVTFNGEKSGWVSKFTKIGMTFNKYRPFVDASAPNLAVAFMAAALVLRNHK